ncbi:hypothetical protein KFF47_21385 [Pseudomonas fluorescens]|nr:hypothetical protein [Pseudomonas fluorescens]
MSKVIQTVEELDAVLHWRGKHAQAIRERDALQQRLTAADEREDALGSLVPEAELALKALNVAVSVYDVELADSARRGLRLIIAALKPAEQPAPVAVGLPVDPERERLMEIVQQYPNVDPLAYDAAVRTLRK